MPLHIVPLGFLLLALAISMVLTAGHGSAPSQSGIMAVGDMRTPASPFGSGAAMRNLLF